MPMAEETEKVKTKNYKDDVPRLGGGPLGLGDPDDKRLRKTESDVIIPKRLREEAIKKCAKSVTAFLECSKREGFSVIFKCREENRIQHECVLKWFNNPELMKEVTNKYLEERSYYRRTGKPLNPLPRGRKKKELPVITDSSE